MKYISTLLCCLIFSFSYSQKDNDFAKLADEQMEKKDFNNALKSIEKAIKINATNLDYQLVKTHCLEELGQYQAAYDLYTKLLETHPTSSYIYNNRGNILLSFKEYNLAIADFTRAINAAENDTLKFLSQNNRAAAKINIRDFQGAYDDLMQSYLYDSTDIATLTNLGSVCDEIGKGDETLKYLLKAVEIDPTFYAAYGNIGFKYQEMGNYTKAIEYFNKVLQMQPNEPLGYSNRSYNKYKLGDLNGAMQDIEKSIKIYPANSYAYRNRALIYIAKNEINKACEDLQTALEKGFTVSYGNEVNELKMKYCK